MRQAKILFLIKGGEQWVGGLYYIKSLIKTTKQYAISKEINLHLSLLLYEQNQKKLFQDLKGEIDEIYIYNDDLPPFNLINKIKWYFNRKFKNIFNGRLDDFIQQKKIDFVYPALPRDNFKKYRFAEWIPDFQFRHFPEGSNQQEINERKEQFKFICSHAPLIYVSSEHALADCEYLYPESKGKISVMKFTTFNDELVFPANLGTIRHQYNIPSKYFMVSNLLAPTKNISVLIAAVGILKRKGVIVSVVVTGDLHDYRNPHFKHSVFQKINSEDVRNEIIVLGLIDRVEQKQLLANSIAIIQPSRFEGWNTLVEEAKWLNHEIILSDIPVHQEQCPAKGIYFRDNDPADLAEKMEKMYLSSNEAQEKKSIEVSTAYQDKITEFAHHFISTSLPELL